jgi:hypothetical protein
MMTVIIVMVNLSTVMFTMVSFSQQMARLRRPTQISHPLKFQLLAKLMGDEAAVG